MFPAAGVWAHISSSRVELGLYPMEKFKSVRLVNICSGCSGEVESSAMHPNVHFLE